MTINYDLTIKLNITYDLTIKYWLKLKKIWICKVSWKQLNILKYNSENSIIEGPTINYISGS